jgi:hypothetical protein
MKHIKKYRGSLNRKEQELLRSRTREKAKTILSNKHKKEYLGLCHKIFKKLRREYMKGGLKDK